MRRYLVAPIEVCIEITNKCNLKCKHCYASSGKPVKNELTLSEIKNLIDQLDKMNVFRIFISGGEPFIRADILEILEYLNKYKFGIVMSSNGTLLTSNIINKLKKMKISGIQISLDGANAKTHDFLRGKEGAFLKAIKAAKKIGDSEITLTIGTVVSKFNYGEIPKIIQLALKLNASIFHLMDFQPMGRALNYSKMRIDEKQWIKLSYFIEEKRRELEGKLEIKSEINRFELLKTEKYEIEKLKNEFDSIDMCYMNCTGGRTKAVVTPNGDVIACEMLRDKKFVAGNIREKSFYEIWHSSKFFEVLRNRDITKINGCKNCKFLEFCQGGCPGASYSFYKSLLVADPRCTLAKRRFK